LATSWPQTGPQRLWLSERIVANDAGGMGSVVIAGDKVYLYANWKSGFAGEKAARDVVFCLDAETGKTLWKAAFPGQVYGSGTSSTPCIAGGKCYVAGGKRLYCLDAVSGALLWQTGVIGNEISSSPMLVDGVIALCAGVLQGFDAVTGKFLWQQAAAGSGNNSSAACWTKNGKSYLITNMGHLCCTDPRNGSVLWSVDSINCNATPVISGDDVVVGSPVSCYKLSLQTAEKVWIANISDCGSSPLIYQNYVYAWGRNTFSCLDLATGKISWEHQCNGQIDSPLLADGKIIAITAGGNRLLMFQATPKGYVELAQARLLIANCTSPAIARGRLFLRLHDSVGCYMLTPGAPAAAPRKPENPPDLVNGVQYAYYHNYGSMTVADLAACQPANTGTVANFELTPRRMPNHYAFKFTGFLDIRQDGDYIFSTTSQDGSQFYIGDTLVVDNDGTHNVNEMTGLITLDPGKHAFTLLFFQYGGNGKLEISYEGPGLPKQKIPDAVLYRMK